ncbi:MAG: UbiA family prenyltransferase [Candidatus Hydrothermarchaeaceae archaeon]
MRPLTSLMIALAVFASAFVGAGSGIIAFLMPVSLAVLAAFFFGCGGNVINDYLDLESDRVNHPERPLPSGEVTQREALQLAGILFIASGVLTLLLGSISGYQVLLIVMVAFILQMSYEKRFKQEKVIGNFIIGAQVALAFIFGGLVVEGVKATSMLAGLAFVSIMGREIVKDMEDVKGDVGKNTFPRMIGSTKAGAVASLLLLMAVAGSALPYTMGIFGKVYLYVVAVADLIFVASLPLVFTNPGLARRVIKAGMLIVLAAFILGRISVS